MALTLITIREQQSTQKYQLTESFRDLLGCEWTFPSGKGEENPALVARVAKSSSGTLELITTTSYFIGYAWLIPNRHAVHVEPKMNDQSHEVEVDYLDMLDEALQDKEVLKHLDGLQTFRSNEPLIPLQKADDGLQLFLIIQFLSVIDRLRRRGLKRSFYIKEEIFNYGLKGRILLSKSIKAARTRPLVDRLACSVQQFDLNTPANQFLKRAIRVALDRLQTATMQRKETFIEQAKRALFSFSAVDDNPNAAPVRMKKVNPIFRNYAEALRLAELVLKAVELGHLPKSSQCAVPPYWIDMSKLFELFVYKKLREFAGAAGRVDYQFGANHRYLDYLCKFPVSDYLPYVIVDAKYKPQYAEKSIPDDLRQLAGYARLTKVEETLLSWGMEKSQGHIPCLIVYPTLEKGAESILLDKHRVPIKRWIEFFKLDVTIPVR